MPQAAAADRLHPTHCWPPAGRLMAYLGPTVTVADVVVRPSRSIIKQSYDARERRNDSSLPFHLGCVRCSRDALPRPGRCRCRMPETQRGQYGCL